MSKNRWTRPGDRGDRAEHGWEAPMRICSARFLSSRTEKATHGVSLLFLKNK